MKIMILIATALIVFSTPCIIFAQRPTVAEPDFANTITYVNEGKPVQLEKQKVQLKTNANASSYIVGIGKARTIGLVKGEKSNVRIAQSDTIKFIVRVKDNSIDPSQVINFVKFTSNPSKKIRYIELGSVGSYSGVQSSDVTYVQFNASKYGESSYLVEVPNLEPGEYTITLEASRDLAQMFGVD